MKFLTGLFVLGMSFWTAQAYEIGLVWDGLTSYGKRLHHNFADFFFA